MMIQASELIPGSRETVAEQSESVNQQAAGASVQLLHNGCGDLKDMVGNAPYCSVQFFSTL